MSNLVSVAGVDVHIDGDGAETIVMIHGWPDTYRLWDAQVQFFKSRYRCVRFTLPGFDAANVRRAYLLDELVEVISQVAERLCPDQKVILMLHDWGCRFGYEFYMCNPQKVSKIIGVDVGDRVSAQRHRTRRENALLLIYQVWLALAWFVGGRMGGWMSRFMARLGRCPVDAALIHSGMAYPYFVDWFGGRNSYRRQGQPFSPECPMLFVYGQRKPIRFHAEAWTAKLQMRKPNQVVAFDTGHWIMSEQPERFNQIASNWLSQ